MKEETKLSIINELSSCNLSTFLKLLRITSSNTCNKKEQKREKMIERKESSSSFGDGRLRQALLFQE
ncbi:CLUMA_CG000805, isoform A [Clunio marinus]|uniref:CLUMA_CG000805, isoform A n=1 Tax=Clunio marinus TaxID=568069 RepID=A0A1J1HG65_9DIPT|nr:CLUMA_CG000805, isoform A [Clunio marinus]